MGITTYNPSTLEVTNRWPYNDIVSLTPLKPSPTEFQLVMKKDRKLDNMRFSSEHRSHLMTEAMKYRSHFSEKPKEILVSINFSYAVKVFNSSHANSGRFLIGDTFFFNNVYILIVD